MNESSYDLNETSIDDPEYLYLSWNDTSQIAQYMECTSTQGEL